MVVCDMAAGGLITVMGFEQYLITFTGLLYTVHFDRFTSVLSELLLYTYVSDLDAWLGIQHVYLLMGKTGLTTFKVGLDILITEIFVMFIRVTDTTL